MGVASLVLGILSVVLTIVLGPLGWIGIVIAIVGIVLGAIGRAKSESKGVATAGLVLSIIGLIFDIILFAACALCVGAGASILNGLNF